MIRGIKAIRRLRRDDPMAYLELKDEYKSRKCRAFCTEYGIGVSSALFEFGNKKKYVEKPHLNESVTLDDDTLAYQAVWKAQLAGKAQKMHISGDIDPYYSGCEAVVKSYYH